MDTSEDNSFFIVLHEGTLFLSMHTIKYKLIQL